MIKTIHSPAPKSNTHLFVASRILVAFVWVISVVGGSSTMAQPSNTIRYAKQDKTPVRCGPGVEFYETSHLKQGAAVEVFHRSKDGWCGVRPPEGSFCWLSASSAYLLPGGNTAEIVGNQIPAWIGTNQGSPKQLRWQLELQPTQQVRVLGEAKQRIDEETERLWYRIAPPQGEFRWIREKDLCDEPPIADPNVAPLEESKPLTNLASTHKPIDRPREDRSSIVAAPVKKEGKKDTPVVADPNVVPAGAVSPINGSEKKLVQKAQYSEPLPAPNRGNVLNDGEYIVGSETVVSDRVIGSSDGSTGVSDGSAEVYEPEMISEEDSGEYLVDEEAEYVGPDPSSQFHLAHGEDPAMDQWSAMNARPGRVLVKPLNGILGLIGLGIAEAEIVEPDPMIASEGRPLARFGNRASVGPLPNLDHLPRPVRRGSSRSLRSLLPSGSSYSTEEWNSEPIDLGTNQRSRSSSPIGSGLVPEPMALDRDVPSLASAKDWHASSVRPSSFQQFQSGTSASPTDTSPMQLTTPELQEAFIELTRIVSLPTEEWDLRQVHAFALQWVDKGTNAIERGEARLLADRIQQFESVRQKMALGGMSGVSLASSNATNSAINSSGSNPINPSSSAPNTWAPKAADGELSIDSAKQADASGWLMPVHSPQSGQPDFALQDSSGNVIAYVFPSPGMNLRRYTKQMVGIYGSKGYLPELASRQIVAERIVRLR